MKEASNDIWNPLGLGISSRVNLVFDLRSPRSSGTWNFKFN